METNLQISFETETHPFYTSTNEVWNIEWSFLWAIEILLIARLILDFFTVAPDGLFANLIYASTDFLLLPFTWLYGFQLTESNTFDSMTVIAIATYWLIGISVVAFFNKGQSVSKIEIARALSKKKYGGYR
jgi:hypothetical protein